MSLLTIKPKINYIIATHAGTYVSRHQDIFTSKVLRYHMYILSQSLTVNSYITQITIVEPDFPDIIGYYDISPYDKIIESKGIHIEHFKVPNIGISYTHYINSFKKYNDFDYYIIMEDDYTVNIKHIDFDKVLVELYQKIFLDNIGFLNCWSPNSGKFSAGQGFLSTPFHSAITLGILSKKTIDTFIPTISNIYIGQYEFSRIMLDNSIRIVDLNQAGYSTKILFWQTSANLIVDYSENESDEIFFTPIQYYYDSTNYVKGESVNSRLGNSKKEELEIYTVNQNFGIHNV